MSHAAKLSGVLACLILIPQVFGADRGIGPKDNSGTATGAGVPPISFADITWTDDFDSYCETNCGDACNAAWPLHSVWPGYAPAAGDLGNICTTANDPGGTSNDPSEYYFRRTYHWPRPSLYASTGVAAAGWASASPGLWPSRWEGWDGNPGWTTSEDSTTNRAYNVQYQGSGNTNQYHTFSLADASNHKFPGSNALNGSDANPLTLRYWVYPSVAGSPPNLPLYVELRLDNDQAPTNYIIAKSANSTAYQTCDAEAVTTFPVVCQQRLSPASSTPPAGCPALSTQVHASLAFGWLAQLDRNPCDVETGRKPTTYHAAVFDGRDWFQLNANIFGGQVDKFNWDEGQAYFQMTVKSTTIDIMLIAKRGTPTTTLVKSTATIPRQYMGPFNKISFGAGPGCELDPATGECKTAGQYDVWRYMATSSARGWSPAYIDRMALLGGMGANSTGACCKSDGTCSVETSSACAAAGGVWRGVDTVCDGTICAGACCQPKGVCTQTLSTACPGTFRGIATSCGSANICPCPTPFADFDSDGDVDMDDFAGLQRCLTATGPISAGCACFDKDGNGAVDSGDVEKFIFCGTGKDVAWTSTPACP
jgi:hypothetical protein